LDRHIPIDARFVSQEDEDGHDLTMGDEEINMKMLTKMTKKKRELDTVFRNQYQIDVENS
jgi:hypothetical protein